MRTQKSFDELKKKIVESPSSFLIILGAGASIPAGLPSWKGLEEILRLAVEDIFENPDERKSKLDEIDSSKDTWRKFSRFKSILGSTRYEKEIIQSLDPKDLKTPEIYKQIWRLNPAGIIDFNLDKLAINTYSELERAAVDHATWKEPHKFKNFAVSYNKFVFFPHGIVSDSSSWVLTESERKNLYSDQNYRLIMTELLNTKNLLIIGFNPDEWSFLQLLSDIGISGRIAGYNNYYLCPDSSDHTRRELGEYGITVIPYKPSSSEHHELRELLDSILTFESKDEILPSIYTGKQYQESDIPSADDCYKISVDELRNILNGVIANIIPADTVPTEDQINKLAEFYDTYIVQLHRAWLVDTRSDNTNTVYNYKAIRRIGNGAFGSVFEAEDPEENHFALKVLLPDVKDKSSYLSCFRRGIRSMKILTEKNIPGMVKIYDSYEVPACIVMDMVYGITLRDAIDKRFLTRLDIKMSLIKQIASIIHQAHQLEERILHRDLKPENIMLENCYSSKDFSDSDCLPSVKILDFDLSWHRGATEKTVMFGAISQGFMAPEQTDADTDKSLSRHTAVDVYSLGMLTYYVLTNCNPMPNESLFSGFHQRVLEQIQSQYRFEWKCLPLYLTETIQNATAESQTARISLDTFITNLQVAIEMHLHKTISNTHPLLLLELRNRIDSHGEESISDFGRTICVNYPSLSKRITLSTTSIRSNVVLNISIERYVDDFDQRSSLAKYFKTMAEKATAKIDKTLFNDFTNEHSPSNITIHMSAKMPDSVSLEYIESLAKNIQEVRIELDSASR